MSIIFGISAKKQGGKSTLVDYIKTQLPSVDIIRFADTLKQIVLDCFITPELSKEYHLYAPEDLDTEEVKNIILPCGKTIRDVLQIIGTDQFRSIWKDCWLNAYLKKVDQSKAAFILTPDVRFPNELQAIQDRGGKVLRLLRAPLSGDEHESETALDQVSNNTVVSGQYIQGMDTLIPNFSQYNNVFDILFDNRLKTLDDSKVWAKRLIDNCFRWRDSIGGATNPEINLSNF